MTVYSFSLNLRPDHAGDDPVPPSTKEMNKLRAARRLLLLIHGYNNNLKAAAEAYNGFEDLQRELAGQSDYAPGEQVVRVFWPGDADWGIASFLFFMGAINNAEKSGTLLAEALENLAGGAPLWVEVVAHSLGCRVTYAMLAALSAGSTVQVTRIVFFAAAVATFMLEPGQKKGFDTAYYRSTDSLLSLYSGSDVVLSWAFPAGSTLAPGPQGAFPTALGHEFWASPHSPLSLYQSENSGSGHSDYWGWKEKTKDTNGKYANQRARDFLRFVTADERRMDVKKVPIRSGADAREIACRPMPSRPFTYEWVG
jgi:hypothetical protein